MTWRPYSILINDFRIKKQGVQATIRQIDNNYPLYPALKPGAGKVGPGSPHRTTAVINGLGEAS